MPRCEDYPCCGHAGDPDGCPDMSRLNTCQGCGAQFHPDNRCEDFCPRCNAMHDIKHGYVDSDGHYEPGEDDRDYDDDDDFEEPDEID